MTTAVASPFRFFSLRVVRTQRLGPSLARVTFGGTDLDSFASGGRDQSVSLFLPHPGQEAPVVPVEEGDGWWRAWRGLPADVRAVMRSYTVSEQRRYPDGSSEIDIDFVLHGQATGDPHADPRRTGAVGQFGHRACTGHGTLAGAPAGPAAGTALGTLPHRAATRTSSCPTAAAHPRVTVRADGRGAGAGGSASGPASRWAAGARPGDRVLVLGPAVRDNSAVRFRPPEGTDLVVLWADETALPAAAAILRSLPAGLPVRAWCEVPTAADRRRLDTRADARVTWLVRDEGAPGAAAALRAARLPTATTPYAWVAGESSQVRAVRRHLVQERGYARDQVTFVGYWRRGRSEEQWRAEAEAAGGS